MHIALARHAQRPEQEQGHGDQGDDAQSGGNAQAHDGHHDGEHDVDYQSSATRSMTIDPSTAGTVPGEPGGNGLNV